jgi:hypothetical protein
MSLAITMPTSIAEHSKGQSGGGRAGIGVASQPAYTLITGIRAFARLSL